MPRNNNENGNGSKMNMNRKESKGTPLGDVSVEKMMNLAPPEPSDDLLVKRQRTRRPSDCINFHLEIHTCNPSEETEPERLI